MEKHLYCCQNTAQNFYDHIIPVPNDFDANSSCLCGVGKQDFIIGLKALTDIIKSMYADMIQNPSEYGLPLIEDVEYSPFNPKAAESKNSSHRLIVLLHALVQCGELSSDEITVNNRNFSEVCKKLKSKYKITNSKLIFDKLRDFGFVYDNFVLSYPDNNDVIPALYSYMKDNALRENPIFSLNYFLVMLEVPTRQTIFAGYLSGSEREFFTELNKFMDSEGYVTGSAPDYRNFAIEYVMDSKSEKRLLRCYSDFGKLRIALKLHNADCYADSIQKMPEKIKQMFRKASGCRFCREPCKMRLTRTFEEIIYADCGYWNGFDILDYNLDYIDYYKKIILLEAKAEKINARRKGIKVSID